MTLTINGEAREFTAGQLSVPELLEKLGLHPHTVLVELNGEALFRHEWPEKTLRDGDVLEIIRVVAGG